MTNLDVTWLVGNTNSPHPHPHPPKNNPVWASRTLMSAIAMEKSVLHPVYRSKPFHWPRTHWLKILLEGPRKATRTYDKHSSDPFPKECTGFCQVNCELEGVEYSNWLRILRYDFLSWRRYRAVWNTITALRLEGKLWRCWDLAQDNLTVLLVGACV